MATYLWGTPVDIEIRLDAEEARRQYEVKLEKERRETLAVYLDGESVVGQVRSSFDISSSKTVQC
jgi:vacuolar protein sorting-associated protein 26